MTSKERGPEWQGDDSFGPGWGNQTTHEPRSPDEAVGETFGSDAAAGDLTRGGYGAEPGGSDFAIRDAAWHEDVEKIRLYPTLGTVDQRGKVEAMMWVLNLSDGAHDLLSIAERSGLSIEQLWPAALAAERAGVLRRRYVDEATHG